MKTRTSLFFILLGFTLSFFPVTKATAETASIQGDQTLLRQRPDKTSTVLWELNNGFPVEIIKKQGDWVNIRDFENDSGWVLKSKISAKHHVIVKANRNEEQSINIRSAPNINSSTIGNAFYGVVFTVVEKKDGWVKVKHDSSLTGWVKADLLWGLQ
jgi:SH3-like domain-containing protein